jgi:hypothetical protein
MKNAPTPLIFLMILGCLSLILVIIIIIYSGHVPAEQQISPLTPSGELTATPGKGENPSTVIPTETINPRYSLGELNQLWQMAGCHSVLTIDSANWLLSLQKEEAIDEIHRIGTVTQECTGTLEEMRWCNPYSPCVQNA